jgi:hypothetical protein
VSENDVAFHTHRSLLRRPGCWIGFLTIIPLLVGAAYVLTNWAGARQLNQTKAELAAAGIELDPSKIPSDRPPDESNFCATPLIKAITGGTATGPQMESIKRVAEWHSLASKAGARLQSARHPAATDWRAVRDAVAAGDPHAALDPQAPPAAALSQSLEADLGSGLCRTLERRGPAPLDRRADLAGWSQGGPKRRRRRPLAQTSAPSP